MYWTVESYVVPPGTAIPRFIQIPYQTVVLTDVFSEEVWAIVSGELPLGSVLAKIIELFKGELVSAVVGPLPKLLQLSTR